MQISVFGLGYVGCVGIGCLAELGHHVIGVDIDQNKVEMINKGQATLVEKDIDELILNNFIRGRIEATTEERCAVLKTDVAIICVGTPNDFNGHLNMEFIYSVAKAIGAALREKSEFFTVAIRSTVMPGTNKIAADIIEKESGKKCDIDFAVVSNPEFLREGSAVEDFFNPPQTVLASESNLGIEIMKQVYEKINAPVVVTDIASAEMIKFVNNSFHALKISFANEVGRICKAVNVDSHSLMKLFINDNHLNISPLYFKPGFAYGGSCLPKDLKALNSIAHDNYVNVPLMNSIEISNQHHIEYALEKIIRKNKKNIGLSGLTFKQGTDDLRYSPSLEIAERLIGKGFEIKIFDRNIILSCLMGKNKAYIYNKLPHINKLLKTDFEDFIKDLEILVVSVPDPEVNNFISSYTGDMEIIDLVRIGLNRNGVKYEGICW